MLSTGATVPVDNAPGVLAKSSTLASKKVLDFPLSMLYDTTMTNNKASLAFLTALNDAAGYDLNLRVAMNLLNTMKPFFRDEDAPFVANFTTAAGRIEWLNNNDEALREVKDGGNIKAIKMLREAGGNAGFPIGLIEAKEAVDTVRKAVRPAF